MSGADGLILYLPEREDAALMWMRVAGGSIVQRGEGADWLAACGLTALPEGMRIMVVPPAALVGLHWISHPDLPPRQGRAAARLAVMAGGIVPSDLLFAAADANDDPGRPHVIALAARSDMQRWLLWAQHHGLDPDIMTPAALLLPTPAEGYVRGPVGADMALRGEGVALTQDMALPEVIGGAAVEDVTAEEVDRRAIAALTDPPLNMRQGDFAKRVGRAFDKALLRRVAVWSGLILLVALATTLVMIAKQYGEAARLDRESVLVAQQVLPQANDAAQAQVELEARLAARGAGGGAFTAPLAGLFAAMQEAPGVALTTLSRDPDGMVRATLAAAKADDINVVLLALQAAGFTITATPSQDPGGRTLADITVRS